MDSFGGHDCWLLNDCRRARFGPGVAGLPVISSGRGRASDQCCCGRTGQTSATSRAAWAMAWLGTGDRTAGACPVDRRMLLGWIRRDFPLVILFLGRCTAAPRYSFARFHAAPAVAGRWAEPAEERGRSIREGHPTAQLEQQPVDHQHLPVRVAAAQRPPRQPDPAIPGTAALRRITSTTSRLRADDRAGAGAIHLAPGDGPPRHRPLRW